MIDQTRIAGWDQTDPLAGLNRYLDSTGQPQIRDRRPWRVVVAVDPPGETAECGIVVATAPVQGKAGYDHAVILEDCSVSGRPEEWGSAVVKAVKKWNAERVVAESNQGGDMVRSTIHAVDPEVRVDKITASKSKQARAEPVSALYERRLVHHAGFMPMLESQMIAWVPGVSKSPDRMDALVHAVAHLLQQRAPASSIRSAVNRRI